LASQQLKICYTGYGSGRDEWKNREELETLNAGGHEFDLYHLYNFCEELLIYQEHIKHKKKPQCRIEMGFDAMLYQELKSWLSKKK